MKIICNKKIAFTLIELLISMAIFIILFSVTIANFRSSKRADNFKLQAFDIEDSIRATQNMSLTGKQIGGTLPGNGYGINFNILNNLYTIYGDRSDNTSTGILDVDDSINSTSIINKDIYIDDIFCYSIENEDYVSLSDLNESLDILFYPPRASIIVNSSLDYTECYIKLVDDDISGFWKITIDIATSRIWSDYVAN
ncbi:MAG: type II secretion system protein [Patescibacteria group bacterium]|nr:type II secretion system protein [Patescibacteria group bacterium]MDD4304541.1 type II secretion system protein [Patescibacteria group bacterium]MDD4695649.1 type II secretion system protein [Patescibacteria group bacterium]